MFPNFKSLAQREEKRHELLEKAERRKRQATAKRAMYESTMWATDADKTLTASKTTSSETQTDMSMSQLDPKKKAISPNEGSILAKSDMGTNTDNAVLVDSGTNTVGVSTADSGVNTVRIPFANSGTNTVGVSTSDSGTNTVRVSSADSGSNTARVRTANSGTNTVGVSTANSGTNTIGVSTSDSGVNTVGVDQKDASTPTEDEIIQQRSKNEVKRWFKSHPDWKYIKIRPIKLDGKKANDFYLGENAEVYRFRTNKKTKANIINFIDWVLTDEKVRGIYYDEQSNSIDEIDSMRMEDAQLPKHKRYDELKRKAEIEDQNGFNVPFDSRNNKKRYDGNNKETQSSHDQINDYGKLMVLIRNFGSDIPSLVIKPEMKDGYRFGHGKSKSDYSIRFSGDGTKLIVVSNSTGMPVPSIREEVDWRDTLDSFFQLAESQGVNLGHFKDKTLVAKSDRFKGNQQGEAKVGTQTGIDLPKLDTRNLHDNEAKSIISDYYKLLTEYGLDVPFRLNPVVHGKKGSKIDTKKYFGNPEGNVYLLLRTTTQPNHPKLSKSKNREVLAKVNWAATLDSLLAGLDQLIKMLQDPDEKLDGLTQSSLRRIITGFEKVLRDKHLSVREPKPIDERFGLGVKKPLKGRGLKGAGHATKPSQYQNVERRGKYYNLNDIRGTGLASAYIYQPIGSKYIRIPDLQNGELNIVYPSRKKLGPKRMIGAGVQKMVKDLVYSGQISQDAYDQLSTDDKRLFKEILHATHVQHCFKDELADPLESLKAEYNKLKGEIELGNDNPSIIKQLKLIVVDMYSNKLISDEEFKHMITRLI